jgi:hypothetical protein
MTRAVVVFIALEVADSFSLDPLQDRDAAIRVFGWRFLRPGEPGTKNGRSYACSFLFRTST